MKINRAEKTALYVILGALVVIGLAAWVIRLEEIETDTKIVVSPRETRLNDPDLFYASLRWSGLCDNADHEQGGCYDESYLYSDGRYVHLSGWVGPDAKRVDALPREITVSKTVVDEITKEINDSGLLEKDCPLGLIMDAGWDYQINLNDKKYSFRDPPEECRAIFDRLDGKLPASWIID